MTHVGLPNKSTGLNAEKVSVESVLLPDEYNKSSPYQNDFSVLVLSKPILITNKIVLLNEEIKIKYKMIKFRLKLLGMESKILLVLKGRPSEMLIIFMQHFLIFLMKLT